MGAQARKLALLSVASILPAALLAAASPSHVWEKQELTFTATRSYTNAYTEVTVWVDLAGPTFRKRVYGFWDGERTFRVRVAATEPGTWTWQSGSAPLDEGLAGRSGSFTAVGWTEEEKQRNSLRRGFLRATANGHAIEQADGTPFFILGDTWWPAGTNRFRWYDDDRERPMGPEAGFKDYVRYRKRQGFNLIGMIAAWPNWATDRHPAAVVMDDPEKTLIRSAWQEFGTNRAKNMDNEGGRPFLYPGKVPGYEDAFADVDRINPAYFRFIDRKIDYLNEQGFIPFIEVTRRDSSPAWKKYYGWPDSYARFIQYVWSRYQANNTILSPIHYDTSRMSVPATDFQKAIAMVLEKFGPPPFGTLLSANSAPSSLLNFGEDSWVTLHQIGNSREHDYYWYLTQIFHAPHPQPALNGEPYYSGFRDPRGREGSANRGPSGGTEQDDLYVRSGMYGSFLSGGFAGHIYGAQAVWGAAIEPSAPIKMWEAFQWNSASLMRHLRTFAFSVGTRYRDLVPDSNLVTPSRTQTVLGYEGWAYCARTVEKNVFLAYFEKGCGRSLIRAARPQSTYRAQWFEPRSGTWADVGSGWLESNRIGVIALPDFPSDQDWGLRLTYGGARQ
jgi:hypothetical protein